MNGIRNKALLRRRIEVYCQRPHEKRLNALGYVTVPKYWKNVKFKFALRFHHSAVKYGTIAWFEQKMNPSGHTDKQPEIKSVIMHIHSL